jgi:WbqC-like protein family
MKIAICQPTYLPWLGYFDLMDQVETFVLLDTVQFEKQSWQQRNRIKTPSGLQWLTVPVVFRGRLGQLIKDVEIRDGAFATKHLRAIELSYRRAAYFDQYWETLAKILQGAGTNLLCDLNMRLIEWFRDMLDVRTPLVSASTMAQAGKRSELLVNICRELGAGAYLSPLGSAAYLLEDLPLFADASIEVRFQHYEHPAYRQLFPPFLPQASTLDLLFNEGPAAMEIIRGGRRPTFTPAEVSVPAGTVGRN